MAELQVTTKQSDQIWKSPDGQRTIWEVGLDYKGQVLKAKTYSQAIATVGWQGTVISEERQGRNGAETFVKQAPKEGFQRQPKDEKAISAMWAISQAIAWLDGQESLGTVETTAKELFIMVDRVKRTVASETGKPVEGDQLFDADGPVDLSKVKEMFND